MEISRVVANEHQTITDITKSSKAYWGYQPEWMEMWDEELTITPNYIRGNKVYKATYQAQVVGYYSLGYINDKVCELDNLFILPEFIGKGIGKKLLNHAIETAQFLGLNEIVLDADPNAVGFYQKHGFKEISKKETKIEGRFFSVMKLKI